MGMSTGGKSGGLQTEINVTPLIDVVLVLLIIFLVTMPIMMKMVTLEVPRKLDEKTEVPDPSLGNPVVVTVKGDLSLVLNDGDKDIPTTPAQLRDLLAPILKDRIEKVVFVDFDELVTWDNVVTTMDTIRGLSNAEAFPNHDEVKVALKVRQTEPQP